MREAPRAPARTGQRQELISGKMGKTNATVPLPIEGGSLYEIDQGLV